MKSKLAIAILLAAILSLAIGLADSQAGPSNADQGFLLLDRANRLREQGKLPEAAAVYRSVIAAAAKADAANRPLLLFGAYRGLTQLDLARRDFAAVQADVEKAQQVAGPVGLDTEAFASELMNAALRESQAGEILAALTLMRLVAAMAPENLAAEAEALYHTDLANYHLYLGELQQALRESEMAAAASQKVASWHRPSVMARVLATRGKILEDLGEDEAAARSYQDAITFLTLASMRDPGNSLADAWFAMTTYVGAAGAQIHAGDFAGAQFNLNRAARLAAQMGDNDGSIVVAKTRGDLEYARGNVDQAIAEYATSIDKGAEFTARIREHKFGGEAENRLMVEMLGEGCLGRQDLFPGTDRAERIQFYAALGAQLGALMKYDEALCEMGRAVPEIEQLRIAIDAPRFRRSLFKSTVDLYGDLVGVLFESRRTSGVRIPEELLKYGPDASAIAFHFAEAARARTFVERLGPALAASYQVKDERLGPLLEQEHRTRASLEAILDLDALPAGRPEATSTEARNARIIELRQQLAMNLQEIRAVNPAVAGLLHPDPIRMQDLHDFGGADALVEYMVTAQAVYCWVISQTGESQWFRFELARSDLRRSVAQLRDPMERRDFQQFDDALARELYAKLLAEPLRWVDAHRAPAAAGEPRLVIVPDDVLSLLPFEILERADGRFLAEFYITSYSPSATAMTQLKVVAGVSHWASEIMLLGDSIPPGQTLTVPGVGAFPHSDQDHVEIDGLSRLFGVSRACVDVVKGACSDKKTLLDRGMRNDLARYRYVHFSTHAFARSRYPEPSLVLFPESGDPGAALLSMSEVPRLNLRADVVTLSACQTALGEERNPVPGEGIVGLTQAFFYAGAQSVVSSLWEVEQVTARSLMIAFYEELRGDARNDRAKALFLARKQVREQGVVRSPYFWGAFLLYGAQKGPAP